MIGNHTPKPLMKVLQTNQNHCWTAQQLLMQTIAERDIDVTIISDYYRQFADAQHWVSSMDKKCAIYIPAKSAVTPSDHGFGNGFA